MRDLIARTLIAAASLSLFTGLAHAKPRKHLPRASHAAEDRYVVACIDERTGPVGGIPVSEAYKVCRGIVKHQDRIAKAADRAAKAIEACHQAVVDACVDSANEYDSTDCMDEALDAQHAFDICTGHGPAWAANTEGK